MKTVMSKKGQVVIPKPIRDKLGLTPGTVLRIRTEGKNIVLEPVREPSPGIFVKAGPEITEPLIEEAKKTGDKVSKLLQELGVKNG